MYKIDNETAANSLPTPEAVGVNPNSYFTKGDPGSGIPATIVTADWANAIQEEICYVITQAGLTLDKTVRTQLLQAIKLFAQDAAYTYAASTTAANTYTATLSPVPLAYSVGMPVNIKFTNANTGAATINLNSLGAKSIKLQNGNDLFAGDINATFIAQLMYDGTNFVLLNPYSFPEKFGRKGSNIASATTTDLSTATGDYVHITGTTTITGFGTLNAGIQRTVIFDGALILTHNATSLILPGAANITTAANDSAIFRSEGSGNWICIAYKKASGTPVVGVTSVTAAGLATGGTITGTGTVTVTAAVQSDQETASSNAVAITPGVQQYHPSAAKSWGMYTSITTTAKTVGYNFASVTDNGTGDTTITFTTNFSSGNYSVVLGGFDNGVGAGKIVCIDGNAPTSSAFRIVTTSVANTAQDSNYVSFACYGDQ